MNSIVQHHFEVLGQTLALRHQLMDIIVDADLKFTLPGDNVSLGVICKQMADIEHTYIESFKAAKQDWTFQHDNPALETSVAALRDCYEQQETALKANITALSEEDVQGKIIDRGFPVPAGVQFHIYREGLLIFYGKVSMYLKAMGKPLPEQWQMWIG